MTSPKHILYARALTAALHGAKGKRVQERARNFLFLLKKRGDLKRFPRILHEFSALWQRRRGKVLEVVTAEPLFQGTKKEIRKQFPVEQFLLNETLDPRVIAGAALFVEKEYMIDATARAKLSRLFI